LSRHIYTPTQKPDGWQGFLFPHFTSIERTPGVYLVKLQHKNCVISCRISDAGAGTIPVRYSTLAIEKNGQPEYAVIPYAEYLRLVRQAEDFEDQQDFERITQALQDGSEELLPAEMVYALADGENPLKVWREYRQMTQKQLAETASISAPYLSQIESGRRKLSLDLLKKIAIILQVDVEELISDAATP
jgi:DNA-binding XRE family transcriptional regulator